jgi:predicted nucleotidyltransferase
MNDITEIFEAVIEYCGKLMEVIDKTKVFILAKKIGLEGERLGDASLGSDIDIVVELKKPDLFYLIGIKQAIEVSDQKAFQRRAT